MEAIRIVKKITDDRIEELNGFKGRNVEIIILPVEEKKNSASLIEELSGSCPSIVDGMEFQNTIRREWER